METGTAAQPYLDVSFSDFRSIGARGRLTTFESAATLWVDVQISNEGASAMAALPGATEVTNGLQRQMTQRQVEEFVVDYISRRGLFPRIEALSHAWNKRDLPEGDFVFELIFISVEMIPGSYNRAELSSQTLVWTHGFSYCTDAQGSKNAENLHPFYDEVAEQLSQELGEALESER